MTKAAFAYWDNRIAPVFDTAKWILVVESESGEITRDIQVTLPDEQPVQKALRLAESGIEVLVCGAISRQLYILIHSYGIKIFSFVSGNLLEVVKAWIGGTLEQETFAMPGCSGRGRRRFGGMQENSKEENMLFGRKRGMGSGGGQGQGGQRMGRVAGPQAGGPAGYCVCTQCGQREPHERGIPCVERKCPKCGAIMIRQ
jgi:predicted Fe-Mo cluster-binding NifX family protein